MFVSDRRGSGYHHRRILISIILLAFSLCLFAGNQHAAANGIPSILVETKWLEDNLDNQAIRIIHVGGFSPQARPGYNAKHIPGAVFMGAGDVMGIMGNGSAAPNKAMFEALMSRLGVGNNTQVVIYGGSGGNPVITTAVWLMRYFGHEKVSNLNGGIAKWMREGRKTHAAGGKAAVIKAVKYTATAKDSIRADAAYVLKNINNPKVVLLDVRSVEEHNGTRPMGKNRQGHIPGAVNMVFSAENINPDGTFKSAAALKSAYEAKGITKDKEIIIYCLGGVRASHTFLVLKEILGYPNVKNYVGSWGEWANLDPAKYPVEK